MSSPLDTSEYTISVRRDDVGRGGSLFMHGKVRPGDRMVVSYPVNLFSLDLRAKKHLMLAGGIGITPFMAQTAQLAARGRQFRAALCLPHRRARSPMATCCSERYGRRIHLYHDDRGEQIALDRLLASQPLGTHLYICGPAPMIDWVRRTRGRGRLAAGDRALRAFLRAAARPALRRDAGRSVAKKSASASSRACSKPSRRPASTRPISAAAASAASARPTSSPATATFLHNDHWLSEEEHRSGKKIMPCVSRFEGRSLVLGKVSLDGHQFPHRNPSATTSPSGTARSTSAASPSRSTKTATCMRSTSSRM